MNTELMEVLERIESAFRTSKPFIQLQDAVVLYKAILVFHASELDKRKNIS